MAAANEERLIARLEANATRLTSEMKKASADFKRRVDEIDAAALRSNKRVTESLGQTGRAYVQAGNQGRAFGSQMQNVGFQVQDLAVQIAGGTSATRALSQQLPQLLSGFGLMGVVMGTVSALAIPLASAFFGAADGMAAINAMSLDQVRSRIQELRDLQQAYNEVVIASGPVQTAATVEKLTALDTEYKAKLALFRLDAATLVQRQRQLQDEIAANRAAVDEIVAARQPLVDDPDASSAPFVRTQQQQRQLELVQETVAENEALFLELRRQSAELDLVNLSLGDVQSALSGAAGLAGNLANAMSGAANEAARMATNARAAYDASSAATGLSGPDGVRAAQQGGGRFTPRVTGAGLATPRAARTGGGRGGGGGGGAAARDPRRFLADRLESAQQAAEAARIEAESILLGAEAAATAKARFDLLREAKRANIDVDKVSAATGKTVREEIDAQAASIAALTVQAERYREQGQFMADMQNTLKDGFLDAIVSGQGFAGVLEDIAKKLARAALEAAIFGQGPLAGGGGGGGGLGGLFSGLGNLFGGFRANGGPVSQGRSYIVGERGPELFSPGRSGIITPNAALPAMGAGSGGQKVTVEVFVRDDGTLGAIARQAGAQAAAAVRRDVPVIMANHNKRKG
jgi:hypothetical protein